MGNPRKPFSHGNHHWCASDSCFELELSFWREILQPQSTGPFWTKFFSSKQKVFSRLWKKIHFHFSEKQCNHLTFKYLPNDAKLLKRGRDLSPLAGGDFHNHEKNPIKYPLTGGDILNFKNASKIWEFNRRLHPLFHIQDRSISPPFAIMAFCGQTEVKITSSHLFFFFFFNLGERILNLS